MLITFPPRIDHFDHKNLSNPCPYEGYNISYYDIWPKFDYGYIYDCNYFINWQGMPVINWRTMIKYEPTVYIVLMLLIGAIGVPLPIISGWFVARTDILVSTVKYYLVGYSILSCYMNLQNFYRAHCMLAFDPNNAVYNHTYNSFPCLNTDGYPYCPFMINQIFTSFYISAVYSMYAIIFLLPINRFLAFVQEGRFYNRFCRFQPIQMALIFFIPAVPVLAMIGHGDTLLGDLFSLRSLLKLFTTNDPQILDALFYPDPLKRIPPRDNLYGMYWSPISQMPFGYYQRYRWLHDMDPLLWLFITPHVLALFAEISFMHNAKKLASVSPKQSYMESRLAKQMFATHFVCLIAWFFHAIYGIFINDLNIQNASVTWFVVQNLNPICLSIVNPIVIAYFYRPNQKLISNNKGV